MQYTEKDIRIGLKFNHRNPLNAADWPFEITNFHNSGKRIVCTKQTGSNFNGWSKTEAVNFFNKGIWIPIEPFYEIY